MGFKGLIINLTTYIIMNKENREFTQLTQQLGQKLDIITALLLRSLPQKEELKFKDQVRLLNDLKIRPVDISRITGRTQGHVGKELVAIRKEKK